MYGDNPVFGIYANKDFIKLFDLIWFDLYSKFKTHALTYTGIKWATSWENLFMPYANNKGADDQPAHLRSLICNFVVCCLDSIIPLVSISAISILYLASVAEQVGLSQPWSQTPKTDFLVTRLKTYTLTFCGC